MLNVLNSQNGNFIACLLISKDNDNYLIINTKEDWQKELQKVENEIYKLNAEFNDKYSMLFYLKVDASVIDEIKGKIGYSRHKGKGVKSKA